MGNPETLMPILKNGYNICLLLAAVFFVLAAFMFFVFDIRTIFNIKTGRAKKKTIQQMKEANKKTGKLRSRSRSGALNTGFTGQINKSENTPIIQPPDNTQTNIQETEVLSQSTYATTEAVGDTNADANVQGVSTLSLDSGGFSFVVSKKIMYLHTDEVAF